MCEGVLCKQKWSTWRSWQLCPEISWALARNGLIENMSSEPSQGGGLGGTSLGSAGIWSLEGGTGQGPAESFIRMSPAPLPLQSQYCILTAETCALSLVQREPGDRMSSISQVEKQRLRDPGRLKVMKEESSCSVCMLLLQLVASPTHAAEPLTSPVTSTEP